MSFGRQAPAVQRRLLHRRDQKFAVGTDRDADDASPSIRALLGASAAIGKPQRHAVVMRDGEAESLRQEGEAADASTAPRARARRPCPTARRRTCRPTMRRRRRDRRDMVDPAPLRVARQTAVSPPTDVGRDHLAVVAAGEDVLAVAGAGKDGALVHCYATHRLRRRQAAVPPRRARIRPSRRENTRSPRRPDVDHARAVGDRRCRSS